MTQKSESSIPGFENFPGREVKFKTPYSFFEARRKIDGAEGLWRIRNNLYDLEGFAKFHPGGEEWIHLTKGTDITEIFESYHLTDKAAKLLPKYFVREAVSPRKLPLTFEPNGFFSTFQRRALEALKHVDFHRPSKKSNLIADLLVTATVSFSLAAAYTQSHLIIVLAGLFLTWTTIIGHNYFHMRDTFRMYYFDLSLMSSKDWRISHALSHHIYPNTLWDYEIYSLEPFLLWLPDPKKSWLLGVVSQLASPLIWALGFYEQAIKRDDYDWGVLELDAVRERPVIDDSDFLVLTNFGLHGLHHLLPTVDHCYLHLCEKAFKETCKEFGISTEKFSQWELVKGQFKQILRKEQKRNLR
ncbi:cytochrome b5-related protein-like isoform X2 [Frieseomelitta varia]|uniref:cytochrome b5-related protein-like isoform X2 n=1 Tax=Frieseomelitta varia TaxID=561572 RepID=UPI001CB696EA|nr:cytochrome b5-related protein-like isoform X2 [Frieseomelitta varia]